MCWRSAGDLRDRRTRRLWDWLQRGGPWVWKKLDESFCEVLWYVEN